MADMWHLPNSAEPGDSGRYGVLATNAAGRAESLADVMVTPLILDKAPTSHKITFTDISDEAKVCVLKVPGYIPQRS